ncbi:hypothetical protein [Synechococcus sp. W55.1]|uniref:DUF7933 domain-containing protein n=1 Tax=Synechococcus sp. W55.1 TaxID=2964512 RepID=UPI0039C18C0F
MKTGKVAGVLACLCLGLLTACQQTKEGNPISSLPGPIIGVQNPNTEPGGTGVGLPSTPPIGSVPPGQPSPLVPPPVSAPTIPPLPTPNPSPSIVGLPPGPLAAPTFTKSFSPSTTSAGVPVTLSFSITNNSGIELTGLNFADNLPTGLLVANPPNLTNTCDGTPNAPPGGALITLSNGKLAANATCTVTVQVVASAPGTYTNPPVTLTSAQAPAVQSAPVNLSVNPVTAPTFTKQFSPSLTPNGNVVTVVFTITNTATVPITGLSFIDILPSTPASGLRITNPAVTSNTCGGMLMAPNGGTAISLTGGSLAAGASCVVSVSVEQAPPLPPPPPLPVTYTNPPVTLLSNGAPPAISGSATVTFTP